MKLGHKLDNDGEAACFHLLWVTRPCRERAAGQRAV